MTKRVAARKRKVFAVDPRVLLALEGLARDREISLDALADEALRDLLRKHRRPATLMEALRESARAFPANDPGQPAQARDRS
jgi:hypothetical protein